MQDSSDEEMLDDARPSEEFAMWLGVGENYCIDKGK